MADYRIAILEHIRNIPETDIAYIAGLIDADGTVTINAAKSAKDRIRYPMVMVLVVNGNLGLIRWLKEIIGAGCSYETKTRPTRPDQNEAHWNPVHRYQVLGMPAKELLARCRPYMKVKKIHAMVAASIAMRGFEFSRDASDEQRKAAFDAMAQIRILNQRGKKQAYQYTMEQV